MGSVDGIKKLLKSKPGLVLAALGLACALTAMSGMRLNTIDGIYPIDITLVARHFLGAAAAVAVFIIARRRQGRRLLSSSWKRVFLFAGLFSLSLLARYSDYLFIGVIPGISMFGRLTEELVGILLVLAWAESIVCLGFERSVTVFGLAVLSMGVLQVILTLFQRVPCMLALVALLLLSAAVFKSYSSRDACCRETAAKDGLACVDLSRSGLLALLGIIVLCFVFITGQILQPTLDLQERRLSSQLFIALSNVAAGLCVLGVACACDKVREQPRLSFALFFLAVFALATVALSLMNYLDSVVVTVYLSLASLGTFFVMLIVWALPFAKLPRGWTPFMAVSLGYACNLTARMLSKAVMHVSRADSGFPAGFVAGGVFILAFVRSLVFIFKLPDSSPDSGLDLTGRGAPPEGQTRPAATPYKDAVASLCELYGLTVQEGKVLSLCAKGKNARNIAEELGVSLNTVKSHMRVVYSKLDIHSQQELIKLVDEAFAQAKRQG